MKLSDLVEIDLSRFELINGGRFEHFVSNHAAIGKFIAQHKVPIAEIYTSDFGQKMEAQVQNQGQAEKPLVIRRPDFPGGLKTINFEKLIARKPEKVLETAVKGMLPKNALGRAMFRKLKVYAGSEHDHQAQQPEVLEIDA